MTDIKSKAARSYNMSRIRGKDTKPELHVRRYLHSKGFRFRLYDKKLLGKPDIVLRKFKTLVFVNGCYWHHHERCKYATLPSSNTKFWQKKIFANQEKDKKNADLLKQEGWKVIIVWGCEIKHATRLERLCKEIITNV